MIFWLSFFGCCVALRRILTVDNLKKIDLIIKEDFGFSV